MGWGGGRLKREAICVYLWLIHIVTWQKPAQNCKAMTLQLKKIFLKSGTSIPFTIAQSQLVR